MLESTRITDAVRFRSTFLVATVGLTESLLTLVFAVTMGLSMSTTAMVARRIGEKDAEGAAIAGVQAVLLGLAVSLLVGVPAGITAP